MKKLTCRRCQHQWYKRRPQNPKVCPKCKQDWTREHVRKPRLAVAS